MSEMVRPTCRRTVAVDSPEPVRIIANPDPGPRLAALVALCEELLADLAEGEDMWRPEMRAAVDEYRARLARLREGR